MCTIIHCKVHTIPVSLAHRHLKRNMFKGEHERLSPPCLIREEGYKSLLLSQSCLSDFRIPLSLARVLSPVFPLSHPACPIQTTTYLSVSLPPSLSFSLSLSLSLSLSVSLFLYVCLRNSLNTGQTQVMKERKTDKRLCNVYIHAETSLVFSFTQQTIRERSHFKS